jgi:hypothetical protein
MSLRIYVVSTGDGARLIEAESKSQALAFAVKTTMTSTLASQQDLINLLGKGIQVERISDEA